MKYNDGKKNINNEIIINQIIVTIINRNTISK